MNAGKIAAGGLVMTALIAAVAMYYLQVFAFYQPVVFQPGQEVQLTPVAGGLPEAILAEAAEGIDADSSPLRYRACFTTPMSQAMLTETYVIYEDPTPLNGPSWFSCYDAGIIGTALEKGEAIAFLSQANITYGIDRVAAVLPDGRGFVWHQMNPCGAAVFDGKPAPEGCPPAPEGYK